MKSIPTWRSMLAETTSDPRERQRIADAVGVQSITLMRWVKGESSPQDRNLRSLLTALPHARERLLAAIQEEFPQFHVEEHIPHELPAAFYGRIFNAYATSPPLLRQTSIAILILQQILKQLDPYAEGMLVVIALCVPPAAGQVVRSLRQTLGRGTAPWETHIEHQTQFFGMESLPGYTVQKGRRMAIQSQQEMHGLVAGTSATLLGSAAACPLLQFDQVAGCLCVYSRRPNAFERVHMDLIQHYAEMLLLTLASHEFYPLSQIQLGFMPHWQQQQPYLSQFQQRVARHLLQAGLRSEPVTRLQAELVVWWELEDELLQLERKEQS